MKIEKFLADPLTPSVRLRIGPSVDDAVEIDPTAYEAQKDLLLQFCLDIPNTDGMSWQVLRAYTDGNGTLAKVLIALGEMAGIWKMHPSPFFSDLWFGNPMYPCISSGSVKRAPSVPKPSQGDLENTIPCACCGRQIGKRGSRYNDLIESEIERTCEECASMCYGDTCQVTGEKHAHENSEAPEGLEEYLKNLK